MSGNIWRVNDVQSLTSLLEKNREKLCLVMISSYHISELKEVRDKFKEFSKKTPDGLFVYIDVACSDKNTNYFEDITAIPYFKYYYNANRIAVQGYTTFDDIENAYTDVAKSISHKDEKRLDEIVPPQLESQMLLGIKHVLEQCINVHENEERSEQSDNESRNESSEVSSDDENSQGSSDDEDSNIRKNTKINQIADFFGEEGEELVKRLKNVEC